jgi:hypothetical protein
MTVTVERIYIGGLDPSRLTVKDILGRLETSLGNKVEIRDLHEGSYFCYVNALSKETETKEGQDIVTHTAGTTQRPAQAPALQAISKLYNNVKWKGCKLKVEPARTHFLERLAQERQDRRQALDDAAEAAAAAVAAASSNHDTHLPRHLKIRKGYGETSWAIDTRPCRVTEWTTFRKMTRRLQKNRDKSLAALHKAHCNRGVHLKFPDDDDDDDNERGGEDHNNHDDSSSESSIDSDSSDDSTDERVHTGDADEETPPSKHSNDAAASSAYVWSDDQDSDSNESEDTADFIQMNPIRSVVPVDTSLDEFAAATDDNNGGYQCQQQDQDDDSSEDGSAASSTPTDDDDVVVTAADSADLMQDVEGNLNVLAGLFPDMTARQPRVVSTKADQDTTTSGGIADTNGKQQAAEPSSWAASGQMLRYDPTKESAKQFVISVKTQDEEHQDDKAEFPPTDKSAGDLEEEDSIDSKEEDEREEELPKEDDVYEQGKLEDVFREARKVQDAPAKVITTEKTKQDEGGGFSFSFSVPEVSTETKPKEASGAFSFSFGLPAAPSEKESPAESMDETRQRDARAFESEMIEQECPPVKRQRRGFVFPEEDLDKYVNVFYSLNEGRDIKHDLGGFRRNERVQDHWAKEKLALTDDWKRKRKYAQSRNKKKFGK